MNKIRPALMLMVSIFLSSCNEDDSLKPTVSADFESSILLGQNEAIVSLTNLSQNATTYEWSFSEGTPEYSNEENPTVSYTKNGTYDITLLASNGSEKDTKSIEITIEDLSDNDHVPYRYLENEGIFIYYETENAEAYQSLIPEEFEMPSRMLVYVFINDFYKLDYGATPYKENATFILVNYQGKEYWHCVYMPVTDEYSMWAGIIGLGLPKTLGEINFTRDNPLYHGVGTNPSGGQMNLSVNTESFSISEDAKQEMIDLTLLKSLQIRNGNIIELGKTGGNETSVIETAEKFPNMLTLKFGEASVTTNRDSTASHHPLDLTPSKMIGGYYLKNTIPFGLTGDLF